MEMTRDPETIRRFLASEEFWPDIDGDKTSDTAWHHWQDATKYDQEQRAKWIAEHRKPTLRASQPDCASPERDNCHGRTKFTVSRL